MKKILFFILISIYTSSATALENKMHKVLLSQVVEHPALNATTKGIIDGLASRGYQRGVNLELRVESAQANALLAAQIAAKFVNQNPDVVVAVGTLSALSLAKYATEGKVRLVFSSVTDPVGAGLVQSIAKPMRNTTGVSNFIKLKPQLKLMQKIQPKLKRLGIIYNPGELNSVTIVQRLEKLCQQLGLILCKQTANKTAEVGQAATKLAANVDAIFISNDNTALSAIQSVILASNKVQIPVYCSDTDEVELGTLAALGPNQYQVGVQTGKMVAQILAGANIAQIPVEYPTAKELVLNAATAKLLNITIDEELKKQATRIIQQNTL